MRYLSFLVSVLFSLVLIDCPSSGSASPQTKRESPLITLTVSVKNEVGDCATDLNKDNFVIIEDEQVRPIEVFEKADTPMSVGVLIDTSESMQDFGPKEVAAAKGIGESVSRFLHLNNLGNEYFVMAFDRTPRVLLDWTDSQSLPSKEIEFSFSQHHTALYDAGFSAYELFRKASRERSALILISDGVENSSRRTPNEFRDLLRRSDVTLYAIKVRLPGEIRENWGSVGEDTLSSLTHITGGEVLVVDDLQQMNKAFTLIDSELHHQYRIGFRTSADLPKKWHQLKVKADLPANLAKQFGKPIAHARQGYYLQ